MSPPDIEFLKQSEEYFSVTYPDSYIEFCKNYSTKDITDDYPKIKKCEFIADLQTMKRINKRIGEEKWGDYESAIAGKRHEKDENRIWGDLLPIYFTNDGSIYGYSIEKPQSDAILVWSIHTIVHSYTDIYDWLRLNEEGK